MKRTKKLLSLLLTFALVLTTAPWSWISVSAYDEPTLNDEGYYEISTASHLYWFAEQVNSGNNEINGVLMNDIVVNEGDLSDYDGESENTWTVWTPIGTTSNHYTGVFDGKNYSISGLYLNDQAGDMYGIGLFGVSEGKIQNIGVKNSFFAGMFMGGVCGENSGEIDNCYNASTLFLGIYIGGVCGGNVGTINNCYNIGVVNGSGLVGGVCGYNIGIVNDCYNTGKINGTERIGGVCGQNGESEKTTGTLENSYNSGEVTGSSFAGGVCGVNYKKVSQCFNDGTVNGTTYIGGVCGINVYQEYTEQGETTDCYNKGDVSGEAGVGGVCGINQITLNNSYNIGNITGTYAVGSVCGLGEAVNCYYLSGSAIDNTGTTQNGIGNAEGLSTEDIFGATTAVTSEQFASGKICCALNEGVTDGTQAWYQNIDNGETTDATPQFAGGTVYYVCHKDLITNNYEESQHNYQDGYCSVCGAYQWTVTKDNYESLGLTEDYIGFEAIYNYNQLCLFADKVNSGKNTVNAVLMNDIIANEGDLSGYDGESENTWKEWTPIGTDNVVCYSGIFDGNGHTVSGIYFKNSSVNNVGLFGYIDKATIRNVGLENSYIEGKQYVGGVCGYNHSGNIENCYNSSKIIGSSLVGGICGYHYYGLLSSCYNIGTVKGSSSSVGSICGGSEKTIENCYYLYGSATYGNGTTKNGVGGTTGDVYGQTTVATAEQFASGEVAYLLNNGVTDGTQVWYQNIDNDTIVDAAPKFTGGTVYKYEVCTENGASDTYGNTYVVAEHNYEYGICLICGKYRDLVTEKNYVSLGLTQEHIGYYGISNSEQLYWFAEQVNSGNNAINGVLMNDIVVNEGDLSGYDGTSGNTWKEWTPIGIEKYYSGIFDGAGYSISGLYLNDTTATAGLFGRVYKGIIKNIGIENSYFNCYDGGGICSFIYYGTIKNCYNTGTIVGSSTDVGGICGEFSHSTEIINCYNTGEISGVTAGGICGYGLSNTPSNITNCYNTGKINTSGGGGIVGHLFPDAYVTVSNCYYLMDCATIGIGQTSSDSAGVTIVKTADQFASGEVTYLLNNGVTDDTQVWYQNIDNGETVDASPKFTGGTVYQYYNICPVEEVAYTNIEKQKGKMHSFENGVCTECGVSFINPWKSQIRFDTNEDGTFAGTFDYRVLATITSDDLLSTFGTENIAIQSMVEAGFVMAKSDDVSDFDYEIAKAVVEGTSTAYTKVPVDWISTALDPDTSTSGAGDYVISCIVEDIPATDKNMCLATMAYIVYNDADGNICYMFYPAINTVCFEGLYEQYYSLAFPS